MRRGEVEPGRGGSLERSIVVELGPVIDREGTDRMWLRGDQLLRALIHRGRRAASQLPHHEVPRLPLDQTQHAGPRWARPEHGVTFPVAALRPCVDDGRARRDRPLPGHPAADLLGAPVCPHERLHPRPIRRREPPITPRARAAAPRVPLGELRAVASVAGRAVAPHLAPDRAAVAPEHTGDRGGGETALAEQTQGVSFRKGDLVVRHGRLLSLGGEQKTTVCQVTFFFREPCCTYYMNARCLTSA